MSFEGPTEIFSDTNYIACNRGYYDSGNQDLVLFEECI